ncbi:MAG: GNAT family N-acyltransferase [Legionellales bacterium]|jgi:putative hemolysin
MTDYPKVQLANPHTRAGQRANKLFDQFVAPLMRLRPFQNAYARAKANNSPEDLWTKVLKELNVTLNISPEDFARIPKTGPAIIVANHPHGLMDGVILGSLMHHVRDDFKIIMNEATSMPGLEDDLFFVSIFGTAKENAKKNIQVVRDTLEWLANGHAVLLFPAGEISAIKNKQEKIALDNTWNSSIIRLSLKAKAPVLPLFIVGQNDDLFLKSGLIHPALRTAQIGRVTNHLFNKPMNVRTAQPIPSKLLESLPEAARTDFIRAKLYTLLAREPMMPRVFNTDISDVLKTKVTSEELQAIFDLLDSSPDFKTRENSKYVVFLFNQKQLGTENFATIKDEIGRLRELTFREVGEGGGQSRDLDIFDDYYYHLTLWDKEQKQLIGAYRLGFTDELFPEYGVQGLYTATQFDYAPEFFKTLGPAMEVSRAFIIKEHQKTNMSLSTLLGALSQVLVERPHIRAFFGAVSISNEFQMISKKLMIDYLTKYHGQQTLAPLVSPKNPPQLDVAIPQSEWARLLNTVKDLSLLNTVISGIEADGKNIPPLIPAYISLSGHFVAFDHDVGFNSIDGLLVINMREAMQRNSAMMKRLLGKESFEAYSVLN